MKGVFIHEEQRVVIIDWQRLFNFSFSSSAICRGLYWTSRFKVASKTLRVNYSSWERLSVQRSLLIWVIFSLGWIPCVGPILGAY